MIAYMIIAVIIMIMEKYFLFREFYDNINCSFLNAFHLMLNKSVDEY